MTDTVSAPPPKVIHLVLEWYIHQYKVRSITNTTAFKPGDWLTVAHVEKLCVRPDFHVMIVDNDLIQIITGAAIGVAAKAGGL